LLQLHTTTMIDTTQKQISEETGKEYRMPILYITELMALAFGLDEEKLGLEINYVDPMPLLKEKSLIKPMSLIKE